MENNYLMHHGILGQKWGVRRYQNADGSLTSAGKKRYYVGKNGQLIRKNRYERAAEASRRDAEDLKKAGFHDAAKAVGQVADKMALKGANKRAQKAKLGKALNKKPEDRTAEEKKEITKASVKVGMTYTAAIAAMSAALFIAQGQQQKRASAVASMLEVKKINGKPFRNMSLSELAKLDLY